MDPIVPPVGEVFDVAEGVPLEIELGAGDGVYSVGTVSGDGDGFVLGVVVFGYVGGFAEFGGESVLICLDLRWR